MKPQLEHEMFAHQYYDSALPVWLAGNQAQIYYTQILPPGEFEGTGFHAPRRRPRSGSAGSASTKDKRMSEGGGRMEDVDIQAELGTETLDKARGSKIQLSSRAHSKYEYICALPFVH